MPSKNMTAQWVERLKPTSEGREDWFDENVTGLGLRVSPSGKRVWFAFFRVKGDPKKRRLTLDPYPQMTLAEARERVQAIVLDAKKGLDPAAKKQEERRAPTFEALASDYLERYAKKNKRSWQEDERILRADLIPAWGRRKAHEIKRADIKRLLQETVDRGAPVQANRTLALIRKIYNWAIDEELIEVNPCHNMKAPSVEKQRERVLTEAEIRAVWNAFENLDPLMAAMFKMRLLTAQRGGEVETMRWCDLDLEAGWWTIPAERAKNGLSHRVPLSAPAKAILDSIASRSGGHDWVFPSPKRPGQPILNVQKAAERVREAAGVDFVMHDLRRTAASYMTGMEIPRLTVSKLLNHVESGVTRVYDRHSYDREKREALDAWAQKLEAIVGGVDKRTPVQQTDGSSSGQ